MIKVVNAVVGVHALVFHVEGLRMINLSLPDGFDARIQTNPDSNNNNLQESLLSESEKHDLTSQRAHSTSEATEIKRERLRSSFHRAVKRATKSADVIKQLRLKKKHTESVERCSKCMKDFLYQNKNYYSSAGRGRRGQNLNNRLPSFKLSCGHVFCDTCSLQYNVNSKKCPMCSPRFQKKSRKKFFEVVKHCPVCEKEFDENTCIKQQLDMCKHVFCQSCLLDYWIASESTAHGIHQSIKCPHCQKKFSSAQSQFLKDQYISLLERDIRPSSDIQKQEVECPYFEFVLHDIGPARQAKREEMLKVHKTFLETCKEKLAHPDQSVKEEMLAAQVSDEESENGSHRTISRPLVEEEKDDESAGEQCCQWGCSIL